MAHKFGWQTWKFYFTARIYALLQSYLWYLDNLPANSLGLHPVYWKFVYFMAKLDSQVYYTTKFTNFEIASSQTPFDLPQNNGCAPLSQKTKYLTTLF